MAFNQAPSFPYHELGIVEDGTTASRAISKDSYVIWKGSSYFASTDILQGATLEEDVNLTAIPDGVINGVVGALNNKIPQYVTGTSLNPTFDCIAEVYLVYSGWNYAGGEGGVGISISGSPTTLATANSYSKGHDTVPDAGVCIGVYQLQANTSYTLSRWGSNGGCPSANFLTKLIPI